MIERERASNCGVCVSEIYRKKEIERGRERERASKSGKCVCVYVCARYILVVLLLTLWIYWRGREAAVKWPNFKYYYVQ